MKKYIFSGCVILSLREIVACAAGDWLHIVDIGNIWFRYIRTLLRLERNYKGRIDKTRERFSERFDLIWDLCLADRVTAFRNGVSAMLQILMTKDIYNDLPTIW